MFDEKILEVLVCPFSKGDLMFDKKNNRLICEKSMLAYPIVKNIPIMLEKEAIKITDKDLLELKNSKAL